MKPILYSPDETAYDHNGVGRLSDAIRCSVTNIINGSYTAVIEYPTKGAYAEYIAPGYCVKAMANDTDPPQIFRISKVTNTLRGTKSVELNHISYDLIGRPVKPYTATGVAAAVAGIETNALIMTGFKFATDLTSNAQFGFSTPRSARAVLGGADGSLIDTYGGELYFDNFNVALLNRIGADNGVSVRYGKNLTGLDQELDGTNACNGIYPYWYNESAGLVAPSSASTATWANNYNYYQTIDFTGYFDKKPTEAQLTSLADSTLSSMIAPVQSLTISFVSLHQLKEFATIAALEKVGIGDTVHVIYVAKNSAGQKKIDIDVKTRVVKTVFDSLSEQYIEIELGTLKSTLADYITGSAGGNDGAGLRGLIMTRTVGLESVTISANTAVSRSPGTDVSYDGYYVLDVMRMRSNNTGVSFSNASLTRGASTTTVNYSCRNNTGASITTSISALVIYIKN